LGAYLVSGTLIETFFKVLLIRSDTGTIGPVTTMSSFQTSFGHLSALKHGAVVSAILLPAAFSGLFAGNVADVYGRSTTIIIGATIYSIGATLETTASKLAQFIFGRVTKGIGEGLFLAILVVYICEITPAKRRGQLASLVQFLIIVGIATGYFISYGTTRMAPSSASWRIPLACQAVVAFSFAVACITIPPSPRWLLTKGRATEAQAVLERLGIASSELEEMIQQPVEDAGGVTQSRLVLSIKAKFKDFTKVLSKKARKQTALACFMMMMQQLSGIDGVLYYAPLLFQQAGLASEEASFLASGVSALVMLAVTIPASIYSDHWGRRASTITGGVLLTYACS
jgi:MFS family permease